MKANVTLRLSCLDKGKYFFLNLNLYNSICNDFVLRKFKTNHHTTISDPSRIARNFLTYLSWTTITFSKNKWAEISMGVAQQSIQNYIFFNSDSTEDQDI